MVELLPIGSVVKINGADKKIMIIGNNLVVGGNKTNIDYMGVPYPEGFISDKTFIFFNHDLLTEVFYIGYISAEMQIFKNQISKTVKGDNENE